MCNDYLSHFTKCISCIKGNLFSGFKTSSHRLSSTSSFHCALVVPCQSPEPSEPRACQAPYHINNGNMALHLQQSLILSQCKLSPRISIPRNIYTGSLFSKFQERLMETQRNTMATVTSPQPIVHPTVESIRSMRKVLAGSISVGFVPTMGALHEGTCIGPH